MRPKQDVWWTLLIPAIVSCMVFWGVSIMPFPIDNPNYLLIPPILLAAFLAFALKFLSRDDEPYPLLLLHVKNMVYEDANGDYPQHKGQVKTHYKVLNRGDLDSMSWNIDIARKERDSWVPVLDFSHSSEDEGLLVPAHGERGPFVPSILQDDDRYENDGLMLVRIRYENDKELCTCQCYNNGMPQGRYINTEKEKRKRAFFKNVDRKGKCKDCRWEKLVTSREKTEKYL